MFTPAARLKAIFAELELAMSALADLLSATEPLSASCYPLPMVASGEEHLPITHIEVANIQGAAAVNAAIEGYRQWYIQPNCSTKASFRLPGFLVLPSSCKIELTTLVTRINDLKSQFKAQVQEVEGRDQRFTLVHAALPGLITLQVYRHLVLLPHEASRLGFTWANKQIIQKVDKEQLVQQLMAARHTPPPLVEEHIWLQAVEREIYDVKRLPAAVELRLRRPVKTHPMVNVRWQEEITPRQRQVKAHLPLLLCQDELPAITPLSDYPPASTRKRRAAQITDEPVIPRLHIYPYQPK